MKLNKYYCYVCGKTICNAFCLVTMKCPTDRVFLCCADCVEQLEEDIIITPILVDK